MDRKVEEIKYKVLDLINKKVRLIFTVLVMGKGERFTNDLFSDSCRRM